MNEITRSSNELPKNVYKPSEIIGIFNSYLSKQSVNAQIVYLRGVYLMNQKASNWSYCYDILRDEDSQEELTLRLTLQQRDNLKNGNLVSVGGILSRSVNTKGHIQLLLNVTRIEVVQEQAIDEDEIKRMEFRQKKSAKGFQNVDSILEQLLYVDQRPQCALVLAQTSITMSDFEAGINAAKSAIDFFEYRVNFSNTAELVATLQSIDQKNYSTIAIVRGGGSGIEKLDEIDVLETITNMNTPTIGAIGHVEEKLFIKQLVDKCSSTPNGLGQYFSEMVETVSEKKTKSRAALTEQIKKQFKDQLEAGQKQNKELQNKLAVLTKIQDEAVKKHHEQVEAAHKQNKALQEQLNLMSKEQEKVTKKNIEQVEEAQKQNKALQEKLTEMQKEQGKVQKIHNEQVEAAHKQNKLLQEQLNLMSKEQEKVTKKNIEQVEEAQKQNKALQEKLNEMQKEQGKADKKHNEQVEAAHKQNKELQTQLENIQKGHKEQLEKLNGSQLELQGQLKKQQDEFGKNLTKMQETNSELQKSLSNITAQNTESLKALESSKSTIKELRTQLEQNENKSSISGWIAAAIIAAISLLYWATR